MDRGTRRAQKARIRARLRLLFEGELADNQQSWLSRFGESATQARVRKLRRHIYKNEGKHYSIRFTYTYKRCDCNICVDNRRYRTLRETERIEQDWREWHFGEEG